MTRQRIYCAALLLLAACASAPPPAPEAAAASTAAPAAYAFPEPNAVRATVFGTPEADRFPLPEHVPVKVRSLRLFPDREIPSALWAVRDFRYSVALQKEPAPLLFLVAGTGARFDSTKNAFLQAAFWGAGMSVVNLSSPTHPDFIATGSRSEAPGVMHDDVRDLYAAMQRIRTDLAKEVEPTAWYVAGYSLGATEAAFLGALDEREQVFGFEKVLMINPAVSLYNSVNLLDRMLVESLPGGGPELAALVDHVMTRIAPILQREGRQHLDSEFLYRIEDEAGLTLTDLRALIGVSFRISLARMLFTADALTGSGAIVAPDTELDIGTHLQPYFKMAGRWSFSDYLHEFLLPLLERRGTPIPRDELIHQDSLYAIQEYLRRAAGAAVFTNRDELILDETDLDFLAQVLGARATFYPTGGHCGNLMYRDNVAAMVAFLRNPVTPLAAPAAVEPLPDPPPGTAPVSRGAFAHLTYEEALRTPGFLDESDPLETVNRYVYRFNAALDENVLLPVVSGYRYVVPGFARTGIHNVFRTLDQVYTLANAILQLRPHKTLDTVRRLVSNLTLGVAGLWDAATLLGIPDHHEDFGQTLGRYGVPRGAYLVIPLLGPSSVRDASGQLVQAVPGFYLSIPPIYVRPLQVIDTRDATPFRYGVVGVPFEYTTVRFLSMERERLLAGE